MTWNQPDFIQPECLLYLKGATQVANMNRIKCPPEYTYHDNDAGRRNISWRSSTPQ
ncbi:MAG: hypothetical protein WBO06_06000 [Gammaproteobacteria bacterium]|jgi:hypothetical protein